MPAGDGPARSNDEHDVVARARRGERSAFEELFRSHRDRVYGLAIRLTSDTELAEDVVLEAFSAAFTQLPAFRGDSRFSTWVCAIALNCARQAIRTHSRRRDRFEMPGPEMRPSLSEDPALLEEGIDLERAIAGLPPRAREALILRHVYGLSCDETAAAMNVTTGTVKSQTSRACALLKERLSYE